MKILLLGGTGAMGTALAGILAQTDHVVHITSRFAHEDFKNIHYIVGNAKNDDFLFPLMEENQYDAVVDFMVYSTDTFENRVHRFLNLVGQYVFLSSSRVYAESTVPITEKSPRLLDACTDEEYLCTDEYALAKARQENLLFNSGKNNWTIIRPYITYNTERLQLGVFEKEQWLYRALQGKTIVFSKDIADCTSTLTYGVDVACGISRIIGNPKAYGKAVHFVSPHAMKWSEMLEVYQNVIEDIMGKRPKVKYIENNAAILKYLNPYQVKYDRLYDRVFDNTLAKEIVGEEIDYTTFELGAKRVLQEFIERKPVFSRINRRFEAQLDAIAGDRPVIKDVPGFKLKLKYLYWRYIKK